MPKKTRTVSLPKRIPVFILYLTAVAEGDDILFFDDVYERDGAVLNAGMARAEKIAARTITMRKYWIMAKKWRK